MTRHALGILDTADGGDNGSRMLAAEMTARGHDCRILNPRRYALSPAGHKLDIRWDGLSARSFDAVVYRGSFASQSEAEALLEAEREGVRFVNRMSTFLRCVDKAGCSFDLARRGYLSPALLVTNVVRDAIAFVARHRDVVLKPVSAWNGDDVFRLRSGDPNNGAVLELFLRRHPTMYLQEYVETPEGVDLRALIVGQRLVGAVARRPAAGHFLTNTTKGGSAEPVSISPEVAEVCARLGRDFALELAGVDIRCGQAGPVVIEINPDPEWKPPAEMFGLDVTGAFADYLESHVLGGSRP
jgi:ribosomal protein S6--L-glutamate ligase